MWGKESDFLNYINYVLQLKSYGENIEMIQVEISDHDFYNHLTADRNLKFENLNNVNEVYRFYNFIPTDFGTTNLIFVRTT